MATTETISSVNGFVALQDLVVAVVTPEVVAATGRIQERVGGALNLCLEASEVIADLIGEDRMRTLAVVLQLLAEDPVDSAKILRSFIERVQELEARLNRAVGNSSKRADVDDLRSELEAKSSELTELKAELERFKKELAEAIAALKLAENAAHDIVTLRERFLERFSDLARDMNDAVAELRTRGADGALAAYFEFSEISNVDTQCLEIFNDLRPEVLGNISLYGSVLSEYEALGRDLQIADKIPSLDLYHRFAMLLGKFKALKELQDQLILDQMAGDDFEVPGEWLDNNELIDFYFVLNVDPSAGGEAIKRAYRRKAAACHSDHGGDDEVMKLVNLANEILSDPGKRALYDRARDFVKNNS